MEKLKTTKIKGKDYVEVNERLKYFRKHFKGYCLTSEILKMEDDFCLIKAEIINQNGIVVATGHAMEEKGSSYINKTSYIENCETSAWGRALGNFGIGIDNSVASSDEVINAINNQKEKPVFSEKHNELVAKMMKSSVFDVATKKYWRQQYVECENSAKFIDDLKNEIKMKKAAQKPMEESELPEVFDEN